MDGKCAPTRLIVGDFHEMYHDHRRLWLVSVVFFNCLHDGRNLDYDSFE